jgi:hypothetical protein
MPTAAAEVATATPTTAMVTPKGLAVILLPKLKMIAVTLTSQLKLRGVPIWVRWWVPR